MKADVAGKVEEIAQDRRRFVDQRLRDRLPVVDRLTRAVSQVSRDVPELGALMLERVEPARQVALNAAQVGFVSRQARQFRQLRIARPLALGGDEGLRLFVRISARMR